MTAEGNAAGADLGSGASAEPGRPPGRWADPPPPGPPSPAPPLDSPPGRPPDPPPGRPPDPPPVAYLDNACMGRPRPEVLAAARALLDRLGSAATPPTELVVELHGLYGRARGALARVFGARPEDLALVASTSQGLGLVASALPLEPGDNVLVCDLEFFPPVLCWRTRCGTCDVEVRRVPTRDGRVTPADFASVMDGRTRALVVSSVQEVNGFRADVPALADLAHDAGAWLIVDGVQEAGCLSVDLGTLGADVYCAGGHKWLRNPFGMGFLYVTPALAERLEPPFYGYFAAGEPATGWEGYLSDPARTPFDDLGLSTGMDRFELGGYGNYLGALALVLAAEEMEARGQIAVERRVRALGDRLVDGLRSADRELAGVVVRSDQDPSHRSGITTFGLQGGHEEERRFGAYLRERGVFVSVRYTSGAGGVRVSPHDDCSEADVDRLLVHLREWVSGPSRPPAADRGLGAGDPARGPGRSPDGGASGGGARA